MRELSGKWRHLSVNVFKVTEILGVDDKILDRPAVRMFKYRRFNLWTLGLVRNDLELCVDMHFTQLGLPLDNLGCKFLIQIIENVTNFKFLVVWISF